MSDDALLSTPSRDRDGRSSGWQEGRMDEGWGRGPEVRLQQGGWEAPWLATGGHPSGANPFSPPMQQQATGHYGPGYGDPQRHFGMDPEWRTGAGRVEGGGQPGREGAGHDVGRGGHHDEHHHHYQRFREEHARQLDDDYQAWCEDCARRDGQSSPRGRQDSRRDDDRTHQDDQRGAPSADEGRSEDRSEGVLQGWGRAITEVVTGPREPDHDQRVGYNERDQAFDGGSQIEQRERTDRFFERS